jgi:allantoinase
VEAGFKYDSDSYADDLPYWTLDYSDGTPHLIIPYSLAGTCLHAHGSETLTRIISLTLVLCDFTENDMRFTAQNSFATGQEFCRYLKDTLRYLVEEGRSGYPKMMSVGLHCRLARPGRVAGLSEFLDFVKSYGKDVWVCTREEIADFWTENHYPKGFGSPIEPMPSNEEGKGEDEKTEEADNGDEEDTAADPTAEENEEIVADGGAPTTADDDEEGDEI